MGEETLASESSAPASRPGRCEVQPAQAVSRPGEVASRRSPIVSEGLDNLGADGAPARLGIMGGTFDPIHYGHLVAAEQAFDDLSLDVVVFMPAGRPAFKLDKKVTSGEDRYAMTLLATSDNPHFLASRFEVDREGVTYTADTLRQLRGLYPANVEFYFITGADAITEIVAWRDAEDIARLAHLVAATRPGYDLDRAWDAISASGLAFDVTYLSVPALAISSSYLRERVGAGQSLRYLTPDSVTGYLHKHALYGAKSSRYGQTEEVVA